jgi:hypothetical protein
MKTLKKYSKNMSYKLCKRCTMSSSLYKTRKYDENGDLIYQSNLEKHFIDLIKEKNFEIVNGQVIPYVWKLENKKKKYFIDFYLPQFKIMIEIKGRNHFYKQNLESGKFQDKCDAANEYAKKHNMKFVVLYTEDIEPFVEKLQLK